MAMDVFLREVPYLTLLELDRLEKFDQGAYQFSKITGKTYCHTYAVLDKLVALGLARKYKLRGKKGNKFRRENIYEITEKGKRVARNLRKIKALIENK